MFTSSQMMFPQSIRYLPRVSCGMFEYPLADLGRDLAHGLPQLGSDSLAFQRLDRVGVGGSGHDDEGDDRGL